MKRYLAAMAALAAIVAAFAVPSQAEDPAPAQAQAPAQSQPEAQKATVVRTEVKRPPRQVRRHSRWSPPAHPPSRYVFGTVIPLEAARAGVSAASLSRRVACESHGNWWANNGQYNGIGQFAYSTFARGLRTIGSYRVTLTEVKVRRMRSRVYRHWSDGRVSRHAGRVVRQRVIVRRVGRFSSGYTDVWAQARIMAQALAGRSAVSSGEWSCGA